MLLPTESGFSPKEVPVMGEALECRICQRLSQQLGVPALEGDLWVGKSLCSKLQGLVDVWTGDFKKNWEGSLRASYKERPAERMILNVLGNFSYEDFPREKDAQDFSNRSSRWVFYELGRVAPAIAIASNMRASGDDKSIMIAEVMDRLRSRKLAQAYKERLSAQGCLPVQEAPEAFEVRKTEGEFIAATLLKAMNIYDFYTLSAVGIADV